jgi:hypothetical protein
MSSTVVLGFIKDITAKNIKAVNDRLKKKEKPDQRYVDPKQQGCSYTLLHKVTIRHTCHHKQQMWTSK